MARYIQGWYSNQIVKASQMTQFANTQQIESNSAAMDNLPCIYNGLVPSITGSSGGLTNNQITFTDGVARTLDITAKIPPTTLPGPVVPTDFLPLNAQGQYPCFIDINAASGNNLITLVDHYPGPIAAPNPGLIVATYTFSPQITNQTTYTITGVLSQIDPANFDPKIHVALAQYQYSGSVFSLTYDPLSVTSVGNWPVRNNDLVGIGAMQWDEQNGNNVINVPQSKSLTVSTETVVNTILNPARGILGIPSASVPASGFVGEIVAYPDPAGSAIIPITFTAISNWDWNYSSCIVYLKKGRWLLTGRGYFYNSAIGLEGQYGCALAISATGIAGGAPGFPTDSIPGYNAFLYFVAANGAFSNHSLIVPSIPVYVTADNTPFYLCAAAYSPNPTSPSSLCNLSLIAERTS